jgi:hypothetical protein
MSHWHRSPKTVSVRHLIQRSAKCVLIDRTVETPASMVRVLSTNILSVREMDPAERLSFADIVRLCQEMHAVLITSNSEVLSALIAESKAPWGAILLPIDQSPQADEIRRLMANQLDVRPAGDLESMTACCQQNCLLIDMRHPRPSIGVYFASSWSHASN